MFKLSWNVFRYNRKDIETFNIFDHSSFYKEVVNIIKNCPQSKEVFKDEIIGILRYYYWCKCEHEIIITTFPTYVSDEGLKKMETNRDKVIQKYGYCKFVQPYLNTERKVDIYMQVMMNIDHFIDYLWSHKEEIKELSEEV